MNIVIIRLIDGTEIIGKSESDGMTDEYFNLSECYQMVTKLVSSEDDHAATHLIPFMPHSNEKLFTFSGRHVIVHTTPSQEMMLYYLDIIREVEMAKKRLADHTPNFTTQ